MSNQSQLKAYSIDEGWEGGGAIFARDRAAAEERFKTLLEKVSTPESLEKMIKSIREHEINEKTYITFSGDSCGMFC